MAHTVYRFGDCTIDPAARELRCGGTLATLSPKVFDCLAYLLLHRDRAVGRDELIAAVWGKLEVTDTLLGQTVLKARRAIGGSANGQSAIRTIPRYGYRWVADVAAEQRIDACSDPAVPESAAGDGACANTAEAGDPAIFDEDARPARRRSPSRRQWAAIAAIAALLAAALWIGFPARRTLERPSVAVPRSATATASAAAVVLPVDVDAGADWAWVRLGLMDLVAGRLRSAGQPVVPSDNVVALARADGGGGAGVGGIRDSTHARYVVSAHAARSADGWTVRLALDDRDGSNREVEAHDADVIAAGRIASDHLLAMLGLKPPGDTLTVSSTEILQRAEAAMLGEDLDDARRLLESAPPPVRDSPEARIRLAQIELRAGHFDRARSRLAAVLDDLPAEAEPVLRARALIVLGSVGIRIDRFDDGERAFGEAVALMENRREPDVLGQAYMGRGVTRAARGDYDRAVQDFSRARVALELAGDGLALARVEANEGLLEATRNRYAEALPLIRRAERRFENFGAINERMTLLSGEIDAELDLLDPPAALAASERAWPLVGRLQSARIQHALKLARSRALAATGRLTEARALLNELVREADPEIEKMPIARSRAELARLDLAGGEPATAAALAESAIADLTGADDVRTRAATWLVLLRALRAEHDDARAAAQTAALGAWARDSASHVAHLYATLANAEQAWSERRSEASRAAYAEALRLAGENAAPVDLAEVVVSYGGTLIAAGELDAAGAVVGQLARWSDRDFNSALLELRFYQALRQEEAWRSALARAKALAGERRIPRPLQALARI